MKFQLMLAALLACPLGAAAQDIAARSLAATCANCHGTTGHSVTQTVASLAGKPKQELIDLMQAFRTGQKPATVMHQLAKGYTGQQIEIIAGFFAAQKK